MTSLANIVLGKRAENSLKMVSDFYNVDQDILMAETAIFHNLESVELKNVNQAVNYLHLNSLCETLPHLT